MKSKFLLSSAKDFSSALLDIVSSSFVVQNISEMTMVKREKLFACVKEHSLKIKSLSDVYFFVTYNRHL